MPAPVKPKKNRRNQPVDFKQTLAPALPLFAALEPAAATTTTGSTTSSSIPASSSSPSASASRSRRRLSNRQFRYLLALVWIAATVLAGVGLGRLIAAHLTPAASLPAAPIARANLRVVPLTPASIGAVTTRTAASLAVAPTIASTASYQATAGTPFQTAGTGWLQQTSVDLQPGYTSFGRTQGNIGTTPVR